MTATIDGIPDNGYRIQFAFGDAMKENCRSFIAPVASEFNGIQNLATERTATEIITQVLSFALYSVPGGNTRPSSISAAEFEAN